MTRLADALQVHLVTGLLGLTGKADASIDSLVKLGFYPSHDSTTSTWCFQFGAAEHLCGFHASQCARFSGAAFQTFDGVDEALKDRHCVPWALVRAYYAAFYSAHALLNAFGRACVYVDPARQATIHRVVSTYGIVQPFVGGSYRASVEASRPKDLMLLPCGGALGGTHEVLWSTFVETLGSLAASVLSNGTSLASVDAQASYDGLTQLLQVLRRAGAKGSWLSVVRNAIQYRQTHGIWHHDFKVPARDMEGLSAIASRWRLEPLGNIDLVSWKGELSAFIRACTFLVAACHALVVRIGERGGGGRSLSFVDYGPLSYLKMRKLPG